MLDRAILDGLATSTSSLISDALDRVGIRDHTLDPTIRPLVPGRVVVGRALPIVVVESEVVSDEPYAAEMEAIDALSPGDIPVYAVAPGVGAALWGELFTCAALGRGAVGAIVDGYIRDARQIRELAFPVFSRGFSPLDTLGRAAVETFGGSAMCGGVTVHSGDYVVADEDGIVVVPAGAAAEVVELVEAKARNEGHARADLLAGVSLHEVWDRYRVL
jgi:regulator of RNase E activity RraA